MNLGRAGEILATTDRSVVLSGLQCNPKPQVKEQTATYTAPGRKGVEGSVVPLHGPSPKILEFKTQYISERLRLRRRGTEEESGGDSNRVGTEYAL